MFSLKAKKKPEEVFTPRSAEVNPSMYIGRPDLEQALIPDRPNRLDPP
jgi:hypothetical protein